MWCMEVISTLITIAETHSFQKKSQKILDEDELDRLKNFLSNNPQSGEIIPGLRGIRKMRWQVDHKGKSGGVRIIYLFYNASMPVFLLNIYKKSEKSDMSSKEKKILNSMVDELVSVYGG